MKNFISRVINSKAFKNIFKLGFIITGCLVLASFSPSLDGRAVVVEPGVFPEGLFAKTVGYLPGDIISVTNITGETTVDILVIGALDPSEGVAIMLSPEAAEAIGINRNSNNIVKITKRSNQDERVYGSAVIAAQNKEPESTVTQPEPVTKEPETVVTQPEPVVTEPEPVVTEPEPVVSEPAPVVPEPTTVVPEPVEGPYDEEPEEEFDYFEPDDIQEYYTDDYVDEPVEEFTEAETVPYVEEEIYSKPVEEEPVEEPVVEYDYVDDELLPDIDEEPVDESEYIASTDEDFEEEDFTEEEEDVVSEAVEGPVEEEEIPEEEPIVEEEIYEDYVDEGLEDLEEEEIIEEEPEEEIVPEPETDVVPEPETDVVPEPVEGEEEEEDVAEPEEEEPLEEEFFDDDELPEQPAEDEDYVDEELEDLEEPEEEPEENEIFEEETEDFEEEDFVEEEPEEEPEEEEVLEEPEEFDDEVIVLEEPEDFEDYEGEDEYDAILLVPAEDNPPEEPFEINPYGNVVTSVDTEIEEEEVEEIEPIVVTPSASVVQPAATGNETSYSKFMIESLNELEADKYYIQIATLRDDENILEIVNKYGQKYPITIVPAANGAKQVLVGPVTLDEYGTVLARFKAYGYKDAFLRKGTNPNPKPRGGADAK